MKDAVFTPRYVTEELLHLGVLVGCTSVLEPSAGTGEIVKVLRLNGFDWHITAVEINDQFRKDLYRSGPDRMIIGDFLQQTPQFLKKFDAVIMSPPYSLIDDFIPHGHSFLNRKGKMAALLRLQHLVGKKRNKVFEKFPPTSVHLFGHRPAITHSVADIGGYAWVIWDNPLTKKDTILKWIEPQVERIDGRANEGYRENVKQEVFQRRGRVLTAMQISQVHCELRKGRRAAELAVEFNVEIWVIQNAKRSMHTTSWSHLV